jgi:hypothetical protein
MRLILAILLLNIPAFGAPIGFNTQPISGLVGHWTFNEGSGDSAMDYAAANHGWLTNSPVWTNGVIASALRFSSNNVVVAAGSASLNVSNLTISCWFFPRTAGGFNAGRILDRSASSTAGYGMFFSEPDSSVSYWTDTFTGRSLSATGFSTGRWNHVAVTHSSANFITIYKDGAAANTGTVAAASFSGVPVTYIGNRGDLARGVDGIVDDVRIYNRALTAEEVKMIYNQRHR